MARQKTTKLCKNGRQRTNLEYFFNYASSPDLSPMKTCWQPPKQHLKKYPPWDDHTTRELILEGCGLRSQSFINEKCRSMSQRLRDVMQFKEKWLAGKMCEYGANM